MDWGIAPLKMIIRPDFNPTTGLADCSRGVELFHVVFEAVTRNC